MIENIEALPKADNLIDPTNNPHLLGAALYADFRNHLADGSSDSLSTPNVFKGDKVNPDWNTWRIDRHLVNHTIFREGLEHKVLVPVKTPGQLMYDRKTHVWDAIDNNSPIGQIAKIRDEARKWVKSTLNEESIKELEAEYRIKLISIYNDYADNSFKEQDEVVRGRDFRGINLKYLARINLLSVRSDLIHTREQSRDSSRLFDRWMTADGSLKAELETPTQADRFLYSLLEEISLSKRKLTQTDLSQSARTLIKLITADSPSESLISVAHYFYGGDMKKCFKNISAMTQITGQNILEMTGRKIFDGWQCFRGNTTEFRSLVQYLNEVKPDVDGQLKAATELYGEDVVLAVMNIAALAMMIGRKRYN